MVNSIHKHFPRVSPVYRGLPITGGSWSKSLIKIIERLSNEKFFCSRKHSCKKLLIWTKNLGPMKLISSMRMYWICFISSWNTNRDCPYKGLMSFIGIWSLTYIVITCILNDATQVGVRRSSGNGKRLLGKIVIFLWCL